MYTIECEVMWQLFKVVQEFSMTSSHKGLLVPRKALETEQDSAPLWSVPRAPGAVAEHTDSRGRLLLWTGFGLFSLKLRLRHSTAVLEGG